MSRKTLFSTIMILMLFVGCSVSAGSREELFRSANKAYEAGQYQQAITLYEKIVEQDFVNSGLYYNLGCAYFKQNEIGLAILYYKKAERLNPRDEDIRTNLAYARANTRDKFDSDGESVVTVVISKLNAFFSLNEWTIICSVLFFTISFLIIVRMFFNGLLARDILLYTIVLLLFLLFITSLFLTHKIVDTVYTTRGVVLEQKIDVRSGPGETYTKLLNVHEGAIIEILQQRKEWYQVRFENGYEGWISQDTCKII